MDTQQILIMKMFQLKRALETLNFNTAYYIIFSDYPDTYGLNSLIKLLEQNNVEEGLKELKEAFWDKKSKGN